jgi:hypothetical protein
MMVNLDRRVIDYNYSHRWAEIKYRGTGWARRIRRSESIQVAVFANLATFLGQVAGDAGEQRDKLFRR